MTKADHQHAAEHHIRMGKLHKAALDRFRKAHDDEESDDDAMDNFEEFHKSMMAEHAAMAEHHLACCKASMGDLVKADMDREGIRPDLISLIAPEVPQHIRAIPRAGQRELGKTEGVDSVLSKVFGEDEI